MSPEQLFQKLEDSHISFEVFYHPPLRTVADALAIRPQRGHDEGELKNLFLRNKQGQMWLFTLFHTRQFDLKTTAQRVDAGRFSFCSEQRLLNYLGVRPGAVSPFCLLNDTNKAVTFYIDELLMQHDFWYPHPLDNTMTVKITRQDMLNLLVKEGHQYHTISFD